MKEKFKALAFALAGLLAGTALAAPVAEGSATWTLAYSFKNEFAAMDGVKTLTGTGNVLMAYNDILLAKPTMSAQSGVFRGRMAVVKPGKWAFRLDENLPKGLRGSLPQVNCGAYRVFVNGVPVFEQPDGAVELKAGSALVEVYYRKRRTTDWALYAVGFSLSARAPGETEFRLVKPSACMDEEARRPFLTFGREFAYDEGKARAHTFREFDFDAPEDGLYEIALHGKTAWAIRRAHVDGLDVIYATSRKGEKGSEWQLSDLDDRRYAFHRDYYGRVRRVVHLTKGRHVIGVCAGVGYPWDDHMEKMMCDTNYLVRCGVTKMTAHEPVSGTCLFPEGRDQFVFRAGEPLRLRAQRPAGSVAERHVFEVAELGSSNVLFRQSLDVDGREQFFAYPCPQEGGFEYWVRNARGEIVEGPWEFAVVETKGKGEDEGEGEGLRRTMEVVDSVDCTEGRGGEHGFRECGTNSRIVTNAAGVVYREVGTRGARRVGYMPTKEHGIRPAEKGERGTIGFDTFDWFAYKLKVRHPGRAHIVRCQVPNDVRRLVTVTATDWKTCLNSGWNLEVGDAPSAGKVGELAFAIWPTAEAVDVMALHSSSGRDRLNRRSALVSIRLEEYPDGLPALTPATGGWADGREFGWTGEQGNLHVMERMWPDFVRDGRWIGAGYGVRYRDWRDFLTGWNRFGEFSRYRGDTLVSVPVDTYNQQFMSGEPARLVMLGRDVYSGEVYEQDRPAPNTDLFFRDVFALELLVAEKYGVRLVADFMLARLDRAIPTWCKAAGMDGATNGVFLTANAAGKISRGTFGYPIPNPAHPATRRRMVEFCRAFGLRYGKYPAFAGIRHRLWPNGGAIFEPTFGRPEIGYDDYTVSRFLEETGAKAGVEPSVEGNEARYQKRRTALCREHADAWRTWRTKVVVTLHEEMLAALREGAPRARFYGPVTRPADPKKSSQWSPSVGLDPAAFKGRAELGFDEDYCRITGLGVEIPAPFDPTNTFNFSLRPAPYTNYDYRAVAPWKYDPYPGGICCNSSYRIAPYHLEKPALALAENRLGRLCAGPEWCLPPADESLRQFVRVWRTIPRLDYRRMTDPTANVQVWAAKTPSNLVVFAVNRTDLRQTAEAVTDGGTLGFDLQPYMPAVRTVAGAANVTGVKATATDEEKAFVERELAFLRKVERYATAAKTNGTTFAQAFAPVAQAVAARDSAAAGAAIRAFEGSEESDFFFEQGGWPATRARFDLLWEWAAGSSMVVLYKQRMVNPDQMTLKRFSFRNGDPFVCAPKGRKGVVNIWPSKERRYFCINAIFGAGYDAIRVSCDGRPVGVFPSDTSTEMRVESRFIEIPPFAGKQMVPLEFVSDGENGFAIYQFQLRNAPPVE